MINLGCWTEERREKMAAIHRKRWGAPDGHCTIYGVHVPLEHATPIRYWAQWLAHNNGWQAAQDFVEALKAEGYASIERIRDLWRRKKDAMGNKELIRQIEWEAWHADQDRR